MEEGDKSSLHIKQKQMIRSRHGASTAEMYQSSVIRRGRNFFWVSFWNCWAFSTIWGKEPWPGRDLSMVSGISILRMPVWVRGMSGSVGGKQKRLRTGGGQRS